MGFATGLQVGGNLVAKVLENERLNRAEARTQEEYDYKKKARDESDAAFAKVRAPWEEAGLNTTSPVTNAAPASNAPPASVAATGGAGVSPTPPAAASLQGAPAAPAVGPQGAPAAPDGDLQAAPAGGLQAPAAAQAPAAVPVKELSPEKKYVQDMFNVAKANKDRTGMNEALAQYHVVARKEITSDASKMTDEEAYKYVHDNVNKVASLPMSIVKEGKDGYRVTAWSEDGGKSASSLMSSADVKKLVAADKMMKAGYGAEGLELAGSVSKDLNNVIKEYNAGSNQMVTTGNTAQHYANADETAKGQLDVSRSRLGLEARRVKSLEDRERSGDFVPIGVSEDGKSIQVWDHKLNRPGVVPVVPGMDPQVQLKLMRASRGGDKAPAADKAASPEGTEMQRADGTRYKIGGVDPTTGKAIELGTRAVMPSERTAMLEKAGIPSGLAEQLQWTSDGASPGEHVFYNGRYYSATDTKDSGLKKLLEQFKADQATEKTSNEIATRERQARHEYENPNEKKHRLGLRTDGLSFN